MIHDNQVDAVVSTLTLSSCKNVDQVLREIRRILKPVSSFPGNSPIAICFSSGWCFSLHGKYSFGQLFSCFPSISLFTLLSFPIRDIPHSKYPRENRTCAVPWWYNSACFPRAWNSSSPTSTRQWNRSKMTLSFIFLLVKKEKIKKTRIARFPIELFCNACQIGKVRNDPFAEKSPD